MFNLTLVTPEKKIESNVPVEEVIVPAYKGELDILPGHAPLMTTLDVGILKYRRKGESDFQKVVISWGYCEVSPNGANILAETAESVEDIDITRATDAVKRAEAALGSNTLEPAEIEKQQRKLKRARTRVQFYNSAKSH